MADPDFGTDLSLADEFLPTFPTATGRRNLIEALFRRWTTDPTTEAGREIYGGGDTCMDARLLLAARLDAGSIRSVEQQLARVALHDDRVSACTAKATLDSAAKKLTVACNVTPSAGPSFDFVVAFSAITAELLNGG